MITTVAKRCAALLTALMLAAFMTTPVQAESKRIEVYSISQVYWDTQRGESLSAIAGQLLPNNPAMQQNLMRDIVELNPTAFIDGNPNRMQAGVRLWLPGHMSQPDTKVDPRNTRVETYSWGNIKRPR